MISALLVSLLAGVASESDRRTSWWIAALEELLELAELAVGECVHWVNDNRLNPLATTPPKNVIDDWRNVREAFS